jgi:hypothetical protein
MQADEIARLEEWRSSEGQRIQRERRVLEKQSRALLKLPNKKERSLVEAAEAALEAERREARGREARHKLTVSGEGGWRRWRRQERKEEGLESVVSGRGPLGLSLSLSHTHTYV